MTYISTIFYNHKNGFDRTAVGLIFFDDNSQYIDISEDKLKRLKDIRGYKLFRMTLDNFIKAKHTKEELDRMSIYFNGIFQITKPSKILIECNEEVFRKLFTKYVEI